MSLRWSSVLIVAPKERASHYLLLNTENPIGVEVRCINITADVVRIWFQFSHAFFCFALNVHGFNSVGRSKGIALQASPPVTMSMVHCQQYVPFDLRRILHEM